MVLTGESANYTITRSISGTENLFEASTGNATLGTKVLIKVYDIDDVTRFQNEVEKLNLLNQIMEEMGLGGDQGLIV